MGEGVVEGGEKGQRDDYRWEKAEPVLKMSQHVFKKSFQQEGLREPLPGSSTQSRGRPSSRAFPAILIIHNGNFEKSLPTSKLTTIAQSEAGFLCSLAAPSI